MICETDQGVRIPGCWSAVIYGDDECTCPGSPRALEWERFGPALERLERMRASRRAREWAKLGIAVLPSARLVVTRELEPVRLRALAVVR